MPEGWASAGGRAGRRAPPSPSRDPALERERRARDDLARARGSSGGRQSRARSGARRSIPVGGADVDPLERVAQLAAVGVRVHAHRAAHRAGDAHAELDARPARAPRPAPRPAAGGRLLHRGGGWLRALSQRGIRPISRQVLRNRGPLPADSIPSPRLLRRVPPRSAQAQQALRARRPCAGGRTRPRCRRCGSS